MNKASNNATKTNSNKIGNSTNTTKTNSNKAGNSTTYITNTKNTSVSEPTSGYSGTNIIGIIILIFVLIAIAGAAYWLYNYYTTKKFQTSVDAELLPNIKDATSTTNIPSSTIPSSSYSNEYSISFWINVQDFNYRYGEEKVILSRGDKGSGNPEILLDKKQNNLIVRVKLQGPNKKVSNFQDIPIQIKSLTSGNGFIIPESVNNDDSDDSDNSINTELSDNSINTELGDNSTNIIPDSLKKIGSNTIDYPTIQYIFDNNVTNTGDSQCGYFGLISGNTVISNQNNDNKLIENFAPTDDAVNASVAVVVDMCNIAKTIQDQQFADSSVDSMNNYYQEIINLLEESRTSAKSGTELSNIISSLSSSVSMPTQQSSSVLSQQFKTLETDMQTLSKMSNVQVDYNTIITAINNKMNSINCPLTIDGTNEIDGTISFYENIIKLMKKSLFTYINNMGSGIKKIYPELVGKQTATCIIDNEMNKDPTIGTCNVKMIPLQKWVNIIVSVYNQVVDIYIDGLLSSSCVLKGFPAISTSDVNVTPDGGFSGKISRVVFSNTAMTVSHAKQIYYSGPVLTETLFSMIPNWVYWTILIIIVVVIGYSFFM